MPRSVPDTATVSAAIALAGRAPSIHNSQPWRWTMRDVTLHLSPARGRWLPATDPAGVSMIISCGVALHHARIAFASLGWATEASLVPSDRFPDRLASLRFHRAGPGGRDEHAAALAAAIYARRSDRRAYCGRPVTDSDLFPAEAAAQGLRVQLRRIRFGAERRALVQLIDDVVQSRSEDPVWQVEQRLWIGAGRTPGVGIPATNAPGWRPGLAPPFAQAGAAGAIPTVGDLGEVLLLATDDDDLRARLRAGQAASAIMLEATAAGMSTCALSHVLEVAGSRAQVGEMFLDGRGTPQLLIRVGWRPEGSDPVPATPRLRLDEILEYVTSRR